MAGLLSAIEAPFQAIGGLFGMGQPATVAAPVPVTAMALPDPNAQPMLPAPQPAQAPPQAMLAAPQSAPSQQPSAMLAAPAQAPPPAAIVALPPPKTDHLGDVLDRLFLGGNIAAARNAEYATQNTSYMNQQRNAQLNAALPTLTPDQQNAYRMDPAGFMAAYQKNFEPQSIKAGDSFNYGGAHGTMVTAPSMGVTPSGVGYTQTPGATNATGSLPTIQSAAAGTTVSPMAPITGPAGGPPAGAPTIGGPAPASAPGGPPGVPRGIRNNNPGNVRALPNGQQWAGQTGTDPNGYAVFGDPKDGVHASLTNLLGYQNNHGINTVQGIINRWAPASDGNNPTAYANFVAKAVGVKPGDKIDLNDQDTLGKVAGAIFQYENGPKALQTKFPTSTAEAAPATAANGMPTSIQGGKAQQLSADDAKAAGFAPGAVVSRKPDGTFDVAAPGYTPAALAEMRNQVIKSDQYGDYTKSADAYRAMVNSAKQPQGGMRAYAMRDTFARAINPGAVARSGTIEAIKNAQGLPANLQAYFMNLKGDGDVPPQIAQQILDVTRGFVQAHYESAAAINKSNADLAARKGIDPQDVTAADIVPPESYSIPTPTTSAPPMAQRTPGKVYSTPRGPMTWTGTGWRPAQN